MRKSSFFCHSLRPLSLAAVPVIFGLEPCSRFRIELASSSSRFHRTLRFFSPGTVLPEDSPVSFVQSCLFLPDDTVPLCTRLGLSCSGSFSRKGLSYWRLEVSGNSSIVFPAAMRLERPLESRNFSLLMEVLQQAGPGTIGQDPSRNDTATRVQAEFVFIRQRASLLHQKRNLVNAKEGHSWALECCSLGPDRATSNGLLQGCAPTIFGSRWQRGFFVSFCA